MAITLVSKRLKGVSVFLSPNLKLGFLLAIDAFLTVGGMYLSFVLLGEGSFSLNWRQWLLVALAPCFVLPVQYELGVYYTGVRFLDARVLWGVVQGVLISIALWILTVILGSSFSSGDVEWSTPIVGLLVLVALLVGSRVLGKLAFDFFSGRATPLQPVLILGIGERSRELLRVIELAEDLTPIGYLDLSERKPSGRLDGLPVYSLKDIDPLISRQAEVTILTTDSSALSQISPIAELAAKRSNLVRYVPNLSELAGKKLGRGQSRPINILDLLGRDENLANISDLQEFRGAVVLVTGGAGTIGRELCRQLVDAGAKKVVALDANEYSLYDLQQSEFWLQAAAKADWELGNIGDKRRLNEILLRHRVDHVFHAAAHKHVNLLEKSPSEALTNNILGTLNLLQVISKTNVKKFVMISTDKAVNPESVMGASKRWCERLVQFFADEAKATGTGQVFCAVRFGNVLGSSGSVIPLFQQQIAKGGPVTVTDPAVERYFMSTREASRLVLRAATISTGGEIFSLDMGSPIRILDLADQMIRLSGAVPILPDSPDVDGGIRIIFTGLQPGEKMQEKIFFSDEAYGETPDQKIFVAPHQSSQHSNIISEIDDLLQVPDDEALKQRLLDKIV